MNDNMKKALARGTEALEAYIDGGYSVELSLVVDMLAVEGEVATGIVQAIYTCHFVAMDGYLNVEGERLEIVTHVDPTVDEGKKSEVHAQLPLPLWD